MLEVSRVPNKYAACRHQDSQSMIWKRLTCYCEVMLQQVSSKKWLIFPVSIIHVLSPVCGRECTELCLSLPNSSRVYLSCRLKRLTKVNVQQGSIGTFHQYLFRCTVQSLVHEEHAISYHGFYPFHICLREIKYCSIHKLRHTLHMEMSNVCISNDFFKLNILISSHIKYFSFFKHFMILWLQHIVICVHLSIAALIFWIFQNIVRNHQRRPSLYRKTKAMAKG